MLNYSALQKKSVSENRRSFVIAENGQMHYNTGDLGYVGSDDQLYYAGRKDHQIKIMSRRFEPGEIESVLNRTDGVKGSCCIPDTGHKRLAVFFSGEINAVELQRKLAQSFPAYMIPGKMICLERMPLNEHGKIDRMKLRAYLEAEDHKT